MIDRIMNLKYNYNTSYKYQSKLSLIKQNNYNTIRAYLKEVKLTVNELGACNNWNEHVIQTKTEECFFNGLDDIVKFEITKFPHTNFQFILESLIRIETFIMERLDNTSYINTGNNFENRINIRQNHKSKEEFRKYESKQCKKQKFCQHHKTNSHSNEECRFLNKKNDNRKNKTYALREQNVMPKVIEIPMKVENKNLTA
ncbi:hypothetical protein DMUE_1362 [Dictyocoela muelleri]|nr:hypothetical protein DMUE_1362 [Dictyocoela muelleri]